MDSLNTLKEHLKSQNKGTEIWCQLQKLERFERCYRELENHFETAYEQLKLLEKLVGNV